MSRITPAKRELLVKLVKQGGILYGWKLNVPERNLASKAERLGLVSWSYPPGRKSAGRERHLLSITDAGREALR